MPAWAHDDTLNLDELLTAFGWDFDKIEIKTEKVTDNFYVLFGGGGNIGVSIGSQGVMIVDDQFPELMPKIGDAIREIGGGAVDFAINTHWHFDHAEGNLALGPGGTWLVSQANSREKMLGDHVINLVSAKYLQKAYPKSALPVITYDDTMQFHFNDEQVDLLHAGPAHTTGDTAVIFRGSNVVHLGDVFNRGYPFIDADNGGDLAGMIAFCQAVLDSIDKDTVVVPGHGEISDYEGLQAYIAMLSTVHKRISKLANRGKSMEEVAASKPTEGFDEIYGDPAQFINRAYTSITR
ncbi:MAG: MBL fold metallo-hydrolase [Pseudomonadales bacterium]|nr:MBL fold metallo-hydrolase [Pseudomonadales bacterium]